MPSRLSFTVCLFSVGLQDGSLPAALRDNGVSRNTSNRNRMKTHLSG